MTTEMVHPKEVGALLAKPPTRIIKNVTCVFCGAHVQG